MAITYSYVPSDGTVAAGAGVENFRNASPAFRNYVVDRPVMDMGIQLPNVSEATPANLLGHGAGTPALAEINSSEICGLTLDASNEGLGHLWKVPYWVDCSQDIDFRCNVSNSAGAGTGSALMVFEYTALTHGTTAMAIGATALDTAVTSWTDLAANVVANTAWGTLAAATLAALTLTPGDDSLAFHIDVTLTTITDCTFYGADYRAYRQWL